MCARKAQLDRHQLEYELDEEGVYRIVVSVGERKQVVCIESETVDVGGTEIRDIWSIGLAMEEGVPPKVSAMLLKLNGLSDIGAWELKEFDGGEGICIFRARLVTNDLLTLLHGIKEVSEKADLLEQMVTNRDDH